MTVKFHFGIRRPAMELRSLLVPALAFAFAIPAPTQTTAPAAQNPSAGSPVFEVVSIRLHKDNGNYSHWWTPTPDGYAAYNVEVSDLIFAAYQIKCPGQLVNLPNWAYDEPYDLEARIDEAHLSTYRNLPDLEQRDRAALMLRPVLEDRLKLKVHHETRILPVYSLVIAKSGFKLKQADGEENLYGMLTNRGLISINHGPIGARFIVGLSMMTGRVVIDDTGLTGFYDIALKWTPDEELANGAPGSSLFTALEEQLGLKLVSKKAPVDVIVVDHVERPSEN